MINDSAHIELKLCEFVDRRQLSPGGIGWHGRRKSCVWTGSHYLQASQASDLAYGDITYLKQNNIAPEGGI